jgi:hypothetical protein
MIALARSSNADEAAADRRGNEQRAAQLLSMNA